MTIAAIIILGLLAVFQLLLALGLPLGRAAWGGNHRLLPTRLRWASAAAIPVLALAGWSALSRDGLMPPGPDSLAVRVLVWFFAAYFALNTAGNIRSRSRIERTVMTPASALLSLCFFLTALH